MASTAATALTGFIFIIFLGNSSAQTLGIDITENQGICGTVEGNTFQSLERLKDCIVVLGNIRIYLMERITNDFSNISFPKLREVTGFLLVYRVNGLESLGQLFPNLARIRGSQLQDNYGLVVHDMPNLKEIGLYSLLKVDRGGVVLFGGQHTCYMLTVNWTAIAPRSRNVLTPPDRHTHCNQHCNCSTNALTNHCWNSRKCQRYLVGADDEGCHEQCLGCLEPDVCSVCRHHTYQGRCVSECPANTIILPVNNYCLTEKECRSLKGWSWNKTCVFECPIDYIKSNDTGVETCQRCYNCQKTCGSQYITSLNRTQQAGHCVYINGSLTIHIRAVFEAMDEMRQYLNRIHVVTDYVEIYGSLTITSLDFLSSLRRIEGRNLKDGSYSLIIRKMLKLKELFTPDVTKNLRIGRGKLKMYGNPELCLSKYDDIRDLFPTSSNETDLPEGMNGYSSGCVDKTLNLKIKVLNETAATVIFGTILHPKVNYTVLYARLSSETNTSFVPETCSESEWFSVTAPLSRNMKIELTSLRPASTYALCIESYFNHDIPAHARLERSTVVNFDTHVGKPEPPFIFELVASSSDTVDIRWVNHKDYRKHITSYELDVSLIEILQKNLMARNHCHNADDVLEGSDSRHALVLKPPREYDCEIISNVSKNIVDEEHFDICSSLDKDCDRHVEDRPSNSYFGSYVRSLIIDIKSPRNSFQVKGLAPFRDYKFKLRACAGKKCSRSSRGVVRTLRAKDADVPTIAYYTADINGYIFIKWKPPDVTNGPVLAYTVQVLPHFEGEPIENSPQTWCVLSDKLSLVVRSQITSKYLVRVCSTTLGSTGVCSSWNKVHVPSLAESIYSALWAGVLFGFCLTAVSTMIGFFWKWRRSSSDVEPLIESTSSCINSTSDPPSIIMLNEFVPSYSVPLRDTILDY